MCIEVVISKESSQCHLSNSLAAQVSRQHTRSFGFSLCVAERKSECRFFAVPEHENHAWKTAIPKKAPHCRLVHRLAAWVLPTAPLSVRILSARSREHSQCRGSTPRIVLSCEPTGLSHRIVLARIWSRMWGNCSIRGIVSVEIKFAHYDALSHREYVVEQYRGQPKTPSSLFAQWESQFASVIRERSR